MSRMVIEEAKSGGSCEYRLQKEEECEIGFTQWTKWSNCDCGEGIKRRTRNSQEQLEGGRLLYCPDDYVQKCNLEDCPSNVKEEKQDASNIWIFIAAFILIGLIIILLLTFLCRKRMKRNLRGNGKSIDLHNFSLV